MGEKCFIKDEQVVLQTLFQLIKYPLTIGKTTDNYFFFYRNN